MSNHYESDLSAALPRTPSRAASPRVGQQQSQPTCGASRAVSAPTPPSGTQGAELFPEFEEHIEDSGAREAFRLLLEVGTANPLLALYLKRKGTIKVCNLRDDSAGRRPSLPYAFIINKSGLKFYFRLPQVRGDRVRLMTDFDSFDDSNSKGEWTVVLRTTDDVRRLRPHLKYGLNLDLGGGRN